MDIKTYVDQLTPDERDTFAKQAGTTREYLSQIIHGHRQASAALAKELRSASGEKIDLHSIRPDIWDAA